MINWNLIEDAELREKLQSQEKEQTKTKIEKAVQARFKAKSETEELEAMKEKLAKYEAKETEMANLKAFKEAGGMDGVDLSDYNLEKYTSDEGIDFESFLEKNQQLTAKAGVEDQFAYKGEFKTETQDNDESGSLVV